MSAGPSDYIRSFAYPDYFHREQSPAWMASVLAAMGHVTPGRKGTRWCEIGCGQGFSATLLAAANPDMHFHGIDVNPDHIRLARARAERAGITNVTFDCADVRELETLAQYHFISCFGVLSWVSPEVRQAILQFIGRGLAPGGVAAVHYMSEPGGAVMRAFHSVFRALAGHPDPIAEGFAVLRRLREAQAGFFQLYPVAGEALDALMRERPAYVAHEYLNAYFEPLPFHEMESALRGKGLEWRGSLNPIGNIDALSLPVEAAGVIGDIPEGILRETLKDLARNQTVRVDLFTHPRQAAAPNEHLRILDGFIWGLIPGAELPADGNLDTAVGPIGLDMRVLGALTAALRGGPATFRALMQIPAFSSKPALLNQCLQVLLGAGIAHPVFLGFDSAPARRLNAILCEDANMGMDIPGLATPALASGIAFGAADVRAIAKSGSPLQKALFALQN